MIVNTHFLKSTLLNNCGNILPIFIKLGANILICGTFKAVKIVIFLSVVMLVEPFFA